MVLRKYLTNGKIREITQYENDRILTMLIESTDELGFDSVYKLIIEIMGRHSNITLVRDRDNKVMESIKHITSEINSYRVLFPGISYVYPPESNKLNPLSFTYDEFSSFVAEKDIKLNSSFFSKTFTGVGKVLSEELYSNILNENMEEIYNYSQKFFSDILNHTSYTLYNESGELKDFYCLNLGVYKDLNKEIYEDPSELLENFYKQKDKQDRLKGKSSDIQKIINTNIERCNKKSKILNATIEDCSTKQDFKIKADILSSYIYNIKKGDKKVSLLNFYSESENEYIDIELDENKTPSENIQYYYKKYNKLKKSEQSAFEQLEKNEEEFNYLTSVLSNLNNSESYDDIEEIKNELIETGYIRFKKSSKKDKNKVSKPLHFISSDGFHIYVGKNNIQNDYLTLKFANREDIWFHTKNIPGSHVIVKGSNPSEVTIKEAANLAAFYSKGKLSSNIPVDYTPVRYIKKPNGSKPGMVIYSQNKTIYISPSEPRINKL
jgi:predicted ribosome quality control (RQC) complex YloA/Tae2 family protein